MEHGNIICSPRKPGFPLFVKIKTLFYSLNLFILCKYTCKGNLLISVMHQHPFYMNEKMNHFFVRMNKVLPWNLFLHTNTLILKWRRGDFCRLLQKRPKKEKLNYVRHIHVDTIKEKATVNQIDEFVHKRFIAN